MLVKILGVQTKSIMVFSDLATVKYTPMEFPYLLVLFQVRLLVCFRYIASQFCVP